MQEGLELIKILLIDDCPDIRELIKLILDTEGFVTTTVASGLEALTSLRMGSKFNLILMDCFIGDSKAHTLLYRMKKENLAQETPVLLFTAAIDLEELTIPKEVKGVIQKPFRVEALIDQVKKTALKTRIKTREELNEFSFEFYSKPSPATLNLH